MSTRGREDQLNTTPSPEQIRAIQDFTIFLAEQMSQTYHQFEHAIHCSTEEVRVIYTLAERSPLMVKEIAQNLPGVGLSKLTRLLDQLEEQGYVLRSLNLEDRRSFRVSLTEKGTTLINRLTLEIAAVAEGILSPLTPIERLLLVELCAKIRANWQERSDEIPEE